jgi:hypothetical protein
MLPYTQPISKFIPFNIDDLIDKSKIEILTESPASDNFVHKTKLSPEVLNPEFLKWLQSLDLDVESVVVWHWLALDPHIAHIDCDETGVTKLEGVTWHCLGVTKLDGVAWHSPGCTGARRGRA